MSKKAVLFGFVLISVISAGTWYLFLRNGNSAERYKTARVERGTIEEKVTATGRIEALVTVSVGSQVSGTIKELLADFNSVVRKGQIIALLEPSIFMAQKKQAEANQSSAVSNLEKSEVALEEARRNLKRGEELYQEKLISDSEMDTLKSAHESAVAQLSVSRSQVKQAEAALSLAEVNLGHTIIASPVDGVVISRNVDVGQTVAASLQAPTLFSIANDLTKMQVHSDIAESDVGKVREGQDVSFRVDAFPSEQFHGKVSQVRNAGVIVQNVVTYDAVIDVDNEELKLKPGMTAYVSILVNKREDALKIPNVALRFKPSDLQERPNAASKGTPAPTSGGSSAGMETTGREGSMKERTPGEKAGGESKERPASWSGKGASSSPAGKGSSAFSSPSSRPVVWILRGNDLAPVEVSTGITDGKFSEVVEGDLSEGDEIVLEELYSGKKEEKKMPMFGRGF